jgi:hypothetical protein
MNIKRTDKITSKELWRITKQKPIEIQIKIRKWNWSENTLRKAPLSLVRSIEELLELKSSGSRSRKQI